MIRADSPDSVRKHGVVVYVKKNISFDVVSCPVPNAVVIYLFAFNVYVISIYRPPSYSSEQDTAIIDFLYDFCTNKEIVLQGDLNLPDLKWSSEIVAAPNTPMPDVAFYETFILLGLQQIVNESTIYPSGNILDLFLSTASERVGSCETFAPLPSCSHVPVVVSYVFEDPNFNSLSVSNSEANRLWSKGRYDIMAGVLSGIDWEGELLNLPVELQYKKILDILKSLTDRYVPLSPPDKSDRVPWSKNPPRSLQREKSKLWSLYKSARNAHGRNSPIAGSAYLKFCDANHAIKNFSICSQKMYERSLIDQLKVNPKLFHGYINHRKVGRPTVGPIRDANGYLTDDPHTMSECFARSFASVFDRSLPSNNFPHQQFQGQITDLVITTECIAKFLQDLDPNSSMGYDGIHPRLLKYLSAELSLPLAIIFNSSLCSGVLPDEWLSSLIVPIYKKSHRYDPLNYRPISLTSVPCKVLEKCIVKHITDYLDLNNLISQSQFGFRSGRSATDQLVLTYNDISISIDQGKTVDLIFFDFSKAFDTVCHAILLQKLFSIGICGMLLSWIEYFLTRREMKVKIRDAISAPRQVHSGVPQGSVLGPLLFIIYINYIMRDLACRYMIFADDIKLYLTYDMSDPTASDFQILQNDINILSQTSAAWGLKMNTSKCAVMRFSPKSSSLPYVGPSPYRVDNDVVQFVTCYSDLGVCVDRSLKFHEHIRRITTVAGGLTTNLLNCTLCRDPDFMISLYVSHVRPKLEYASQLWNSGYVGDMKLLERVQRRWTRTINNFDSLSYAERLRQLDLFSLKGRLLRADLIFVWKIFHGLSALSPENLFQIATSNITRGHPFKIYVPRTRLDVRYRFLSVRIINIWNSLSRETVLAESLSIFKRLLKADLGSKLYEYDL